MLKVGVTGGIGSGKSTVCALFEVLGIPVFYADEEARHLMDTDIALRSAITHFFGDHIYINEKLDRAALAKSVFGQPDKLAALNALVHPVTVAAGEAWMSEQQAPYAIKEAAIFFESGTEAGVDVMIGVSAPLELRISRAMMRDGLTREDVLARMARQMPEDEKMRRCNYVIINDDVTALIPQVLELDKRLRAA